MRSVMYREAYRVKTWSKLRMYTYTTPNNKDSALVLWRKYGLEKKPTAAGFGWLI